MNHLSLELGGLKFGQQMNSVSLGMNEKFLMVQR